MPDRCEVARPFGAPDWHLSSSIADRGRGARGQASVLSSARGGDREVTGAPGTARRPNACRTHPLWPADRKQAADVNAAPGDGAPPAREGSWPLPRIRWQGGVSQRGHSWRGEAQEGGARPAAPPRGPHHTPRGGRSPPLMHLWRRRPRSNDQVLGSKAPPAKVKRLSPQALYGRSVAGASADVPRSQG